MFLIEKIRNWYRRFERPISSFSLILGFIFDALTLKRVDTSWEISWICVHLIIVGLFIILIHTKNIETGDEKNPKKAVSCQPDLFFLVRQNRCADLQKALDDGADPNPTDACGNTPLWWATMLRYLRCAKILIAHKADVNQANGQGDTPLHALMPQYYSMSDMEFDEWVVIFSAACADMSVVNHDGICALEWLPSDLEIFVVPVCDVPL